MLIVWLMPQSLNRHICRDSLTPLTRSAWRLSRLYRMWIIQYNCLQSSVIVCVELISRLLIRGFSWCFTTSLSVGINPLYITGLCVARRRHMQLYSLRDLPVRAGIRQCEMRRAQGKSGSLIYSSFISNSVIAFYTILIILYSTNASVNF